MFILIVAIVAIVAAVAKHITVVVAMWLVFYYTLFLSCSIRLRFSSICLLLQQIPFPFQ